MVPPWACTRALVIASPIPDPPGPVARAVGTVEPFEDVREVVGGDALAAVGDTEVDVSGG